MRSRGHVATAGTVFQTHPVSCRVSSVRLRVSQAAGRHRIELQRGDSGARYEVANDVQGQLRSVGVKTLTAPPVPAGIIARWISCGRPRV